MLLSASFPPATSLHPYLVFLFAIALLRRTSPYYFASRAYVSSTCHDIIKENTHRLLSKLLRVHKLGNSIPDLLLGSLGLQIDMVGPMPVSR